MKENLLMTSMCLVDDEYIAEASPIAAKPMTHIRRKIIRKYISLAACLAAVLILGQDMLVSLRLIPTTIHILPQYTASSLGNLMNVGGLMDGSPTNAYETVYAPIGEDPTVSPVSDSLFTKVYAGTFASLPLNKSSFQAFTDEIMNRLATAIGISIHTYTVKKRDTGWSPNTLSANSGRNNTLDFEWVSEQSSEMQEFTLGYTKDHPIILNGQIVQVDFNMTDEELKTALEPIRDELFSLFGVEFKDIRIDRQYNGYSPYGADRVTIYFYNENAHPMNLYGSLPLSDFVEIQASISSEAADSVSTRCFVTYREYRAPAKLRYTVSQIVTTVSLSRAEELLKKGYSLGNHNCELCMGSQERIDFENYDYVGLTYDFSFHSLSYTTFKEAVPFYAFYKKLEDTENGLTRYAVTYVPAIHVVGYESYFINRKDNHQEPITTAEMQDEDP